MKHIFFVEDDLSLINGLSFAIKKQGYALTVARTSVEAEQLWENGNYDLVILDVTLPDGSGFDLCRKIRASSKVPIMFLTAADEETDIIMGLDIGGDDYMTKPFKLAVFLSRINALLRRSENFNQEQAEPELQSNGIRVQLLKQEVTKNGVPLDLTASEYKLLRLFMENPNIILSPEQILSKLWDCDEKYIDNNTLTVYMQQEVNDSPELKEFTSLSEQELDRIENLVQNLLKITKLDAGTITLEKQPQNVADMMGYIERHFAYQAQQQRKTLILSGDEEVTLVCDQTWLIEAVSNIVKNAFDHTKTGATIRITWRAFASVVQIIISDDGSGIHPEDLPHIFKRFYRSRFSKDTQGIGLGLPLAKAIIEDHNGTIEVNSTLGVGTTFTINFLNPTKL